MLASRSLVLTFAAGVAASWAAGCGNSSPSKPAHDQPAAGSAGSAAASAPATGSAAPATGSAAPAAAATPPASAVEPTTLTAEQQQQDAQNAPLAQAILDAYANSNGLYTLVATWSPDGKQILFGSPRDGAPEIYAGDPQQPADPPVAITKGPERALWAHFTPDGKSIVYLRDSKGDENNHIWKVNLDGSNPTDLTPGEPWRRDNVYLPKRRQNVMIYGASKVSSPETVIYEHDLTGKPERSAYIHPGPAQLASVTDDGTHALIIALNSLNDNVVFDLELAGSSTRRIYPPENIKVYPPESKQASVTAAEYAPDGSRIYVATDEGAESSVILAFDAKTGAQLARYVSPAPKGAPLDLVVSPTGDRLAVHVDAGNVGQLRILDAKTLKLQREVKVPLGQVDLGEFKPDGTQVSIMVSQPDHPSDPYAVDVATGALHPLRGDARGIDKLPKLVASIESVKAFDGLTLPTNLYLPAGAAGERHPTIVMFHGGPAASALLRWNPYARFFVSLGYAVVEPNVRGSTGFGRAFEAADNREKRADWLKDLETENAWAKRQPWCDPDRVIVLGGSYGGYTTLMALTRQPTLWRAGVDLFGIADLKTFLRSTDAMIRSVFVGEFGDVDKDGPLLDQFSPMRDVDKIVRPLFVYAGQHDPRVPRSESDAIVSALRVRKVPVEYMVAANEGHSVDHRENKIELLTRVARFLTASTAAAATAPGAK